MIIRRKVSVQRTARLVQVCGKFDLPTERTSVREWDVDLRLPEDWQVMVIVGPSMSGKSTIAHQLFPGELVDSSGGEYWPWPKDKCIADGFPAGMSIDEICGLLSSVGFSSPPDWKKPYGALSNGGKFRVDLARTLAERTGAADATGRNRAVIDEFGSLVHAQARLVAASAAAKAVRRRTGADGKPSQLVALLVHEDAVPYFEPDVVIRVEPGRKVTADVTRGLLRRPPMEFKIVRADPSAWECFRHRDRLALRHRPYPPDVRRPRQIEVIAEKLHQPRLFKLADALPTACAPSRSCVIISCVTNGIARSPVADQCLASLFPDGMVAALYSNDFDEIASLPPLWEQEYLQIGRGAYEGQMFMAMTSRLCIGMESSSIGLLIRGCIPHGCAIIAIPFRCGGMSVYRGEELTDNSAIIVYSGEEISFRSVCPFDVFTLVVERNLLEHHAQRVLGRPLDTLRCNGQAVIRDAPAMQRRIIAIVARLRAQKGQLSNLLQDTIYAAAFEGEMCEQVLTGLAARPPTKPNAERAELAWSVEHFLQSHLRHDISIDDLCSYSGYSERSLHLAFREHIRSTPKAYLKILLLNAARRDLRAGVSGTTVTNIAVRWGFVHFGRFSLDYKAMFGESPHETLHRSRPGPRHGRRKP